MLIDHLQNIFGFESFQPMQYEIIQHVLSGNNAFILMPTSAGKSLCYQLPALLLPGVTVVVSPLIALIKNQVSKLRALNINCVAYISSDVPLQDIHDVLYKLKYDTNQIKLLYITPERATSSWFLSEIKHVNVSLIAIDEAHCISQWGHDFRPEYRNLCDMVRQFINVPRLAITATADQYTKLDVMHQLLLLNARVFTTSMLRHNIEYATEEKHLAKSQLLKFLFNHKFDSGIVYCNSRSTAETITLLLVESGYYARCYHAGLSVAIRDKFHDDFLQRDFIVVATIAFGMGIDKPNIRFVYHFDMPRSIDNFYQESGRAGRDGAAAISVVNFGFREVLLTGRMIFESELSELSMRYALMKLRDMLAYCDSADCRVVKLMHLMRQEEVSSCGVCDNCINPKSMSDMTAVVQQILHTVDILGQRASITHIIDILRGAKIKSYEDYKLPMFGICSKYSTRSLRRIIRHMFGNHIIDIDFMSAKVKLNHKFNKICKYGESVMLPSQGIA